MRERREGREGREGSHRHKGTGEGQERAAESKRDEREGKDEN